MKPFDLEAAKRGEPIQTRDGRPVKFISHVPECEGSYRVIVLIYGRLYTNSYAEDGITFHNVSHSSDLLMAPRKRTVWVNLYPSGQATYYESSVVADNLGLSYRLGGRAYPVEIEE